MLNIHNEQGEDFRFSTTKFQFESALSQCYTLRVDIHSDEELPAFSSISLQPAHFSFTNESGDLEWIHGYVTALDSHCLTIRPFLYLLHYARQFKVWNGQSRMTMAKSLVDPLVKQLGRSASAVQWNVSDLLLTAADPRFVLQYADNDLASFEDLLQLSARYYFVQTETEEQLVLIDQPSFLEEQTQVFSFDPSKREEVGSSTPVFYECNFCETEQPLTARPRYVDITTPDTSRTHIQKEDATTHEFNSYAPTAQYDVIQQHEQAQLNSGCLHYELGSYCNLLSIGQRFTLEEPDSGESMPLFLESLTLIGNLKSPLEANTQPNAQDLAEEGSPLALPSNTVGAKTWQFQVNMVARQYTPEQLSFLAPVKPARRAPGMIRGAMIPELAAVSPMGQYEVQFPVDVVAGNPNPRVLMRDIQETATLGGGTSHSVTGKAEVLIASQDGMPSDWLIMGSLTNEGREATVTQENYRDSRIDTNSGLAVHMRRTDETNPHGELGVHLANAQGKAAKLNLGTNNDLLSEAPDAHGTQVASTSYAKTLTSANHYTTVGELDNPVVQTSLTQQNGQLQSHKETNVSGGSSSQTYWTHSPAAVTPLTQKPLPPNFISTLTDEEKLFFATVYGEACGQTAPAWIAIASVIMNRVAKYEWKENCTNVTQVIEYPSAFSSYYDPKIKGPSAQFMSAKNYLNDPNAHAAPDNLYQIMQITRPFYQGLYLKNSITSILLFYYSPRHQAQPGYITQDLEKKFITEVTVPGVSSEDFLFYTYTWLYEKYQQQNE